MAGKCIILLRMLLCLNNMFMRASYNYAVLIDTLSVVKPSLEVWTFIALVSSSMSEIRFATSGSPILSPSPVRSAASITTALVHLCILSFLSYS